MTERIYYQDSRIIEFVAKVLLRKEAADGFWISLNRTAFYPTSGGQPHDIGTIEGIDVFDVRDEGDEIWHRVNGFPSSNSVKGEINWERRFDHMQQHTGQHILSTTILDLFNANTIGFHIGYETTTIDLDIANLTDAEIYEIEHLTNQKIWDNIPISVYFIDQDEFENYPFRKPPLLKRSIRVIQIGDIDFSACGGTHVQSTGEIGMIKITHVESNKGGLRMYFSAGRRCLDNHQNAWNLINTIARDLSVHINDLPKTINRIQDRVGNYQREIIDLKDTNAKLEADIIWKNAEDIFAHKFTYTHFYGRSIEEIRTIIKHLRQYSTTISISLTDLNDHTHIICSTSDDVEQFKANNILKEIVTSLGGKGGGSPFLAEGGFPTISKEEVKDRIFRIVTNQHYE